MRTTILTEQKRGGGVAADPRKSLFLKRRFLLNGTFAFSAPGDGYTIRIAGKNIPLEQVSSYRLCGT